jgi:DNA invertase Pin-like site-specific DNA recombinase
MKYIAYYRVSTKQQGKSGLGLDAQKKMVTDFITSDGGEVTGEFTEVESGKHDERPELLRAMKQAALVGGKLLVGKLDRLSRDLHFITSLQKSRVGFVVCDLPGCDSFTIHIYGALAQRERELISSRTKSALAEAKKRGVKLGTDNLHMVDIAEASKRGVASIQERADVFATKVRPVILDMQQAGKSLNKIAEALDDLGVATARGGKWTATAVKNLLAR